MSILETIKALNSTARTIIATVLVGGVGIVGYQGYELYQAPQLELQRTKNELTSGEPRVPSAVTARIFHQ